MKKLKKKYHKPAVKETKIKLNLFTSRGFVDPEQEMLLAMLCSTVCFAAETKILMADKTEKEIINIKAGDKILSYDFRQGKTMVARVAKVVFSEASNYLLINGKLKASHEHPLWVNNSAWRKAFELKLGDTLIDYKGQEIMVSSVYERQQKQTFYNLLLEAGSHIYFANDILVHNGIFYLKKEDKETYRKFFVFAAGFKR